MSTPSHAQSANPTSQKGLIKEPVHFLVEAHSSLTEAALKVAILIKKIDQGDHSPNHIRSGLQDAIKSTADSGKTLADTYPKFQA